jgi:hypothetical protein
MQRIGRDKVQRPTSKVQSPTQIRTGTRGGLQFSLKGWQKVAGGRSVAQTTGRQEQRSSTLVEGCQKVRTEQPNFWRVLAPNQGADNKSETSGGLRYAATTGYFLLTLRVNLFTGLS